MECRRVRENLLAYIKREIETDKPIEIEKHLAQCEKCRMRKEKIVAHLNIYGQLSSFQSFSQGWQNLHDRIQQPHSPQKLDYSPTRTRYSTYFGIAAMLALMMLFLSTYYFSGRPEWNIRVIQGKLKVNPAKIVDVNSVLKLKEGTELSTAVGETVKCRLRGKITIAFGGNTEVKLEATPRLLLRKGEVYVTTKGREHLVVRTQAGEVYVTGTVFSVSCASSLTTLAVYRGSVCFRNRLGSVMVRKGQILEAKAGNAPKFSENEPSRDYPWWTDAPISLTLEANRRPPSLCLHLKNIRLHPVTLAPFSGGTPRFFLHIKTRENSYTIPLRSTLTSVPNTPMVIPPLGTRIVKCDLSKETGSGGEYRFIVRYNGNGENNWRGITASPPLKVNWN